MTLFKKTITLDIETIPNLELAAQMYSWENPDEYEDQFDRKVRGGFPPIHLHKIVSISALIVDQSGDDIAVDLINMNSKDNTEAEILSQFLKLMSHDDFVTITWNGARFDLPVMQNRYTNLISTVDKTSWFSTAQFTDRVLHYDLKNELYSHFGDAKAPSLADHSVVCNLPGKLGIMGAKVWDAYKAGDIQGIADYNDIDVINTHFCFLRHKQVMFNEDVSKEFTAILKTLASLAKSNSLIKTWVKGLSKDWRKLFIKDSSK